MFEIFIYVCIYYIFLLHPYPKHTLPNSPLSLPTLHLRNSCALFWSPLSSLSTSYWHEYWSIFWSMCRLSKIISLKKTDSHFAMYLQSLKDLQIGVRLMNSSLDCSGALTDLFLHKSWAGNYGLCEFICTMGLFSPGSIVSQEGCKVSMSFDFSTHLFQDYTWDLGRRSCDTKVSFIAENSVIL